MATGLVNGNMIYLDTHVLIWLFDNDLKRFTRKGLQEIEENPLRFSPMARLELQHLHEIDKISVPAAEILAFLRQAIGLLECPLPFGEVVMAAMKLHWTRDAFDRLIVAQSLTGAARLLTKDRHLLENAPNTFW